VHFPTPFGPAVYGTSLQHQGSRSIENACYYDNEKDNWSSIIWQNLVVGVKTYFGLMTIDLL